MGGCCSYNMNFLHVCWLLPDFSDPCEDTNLDDRPNILHITLLSIMHGFKGCDCCIIVALIVCLIKS
jgi:hypothetical protein